MSKSMFPETVGKEEKKSKKQIMREKILDMPTLELKGDNIVKDFKQGKKVMLEVEAELLKDENGVNKWELAEGEKSEHKQIVIIKKIKVV